MDKMTHIQEVEYNNRLYMITVELDVGLVLNSHGRRAINNQSKKAVDAGGALVVRAKEVRSEAII